MLIDFSTISHDYYGNVEQPVVTLKTPHGAVISTIPAMNISLICRFNDVSEATFDVPAYVDGEKTFNYDEITGLRLVEIGDFGDFVLINPERNNEGGIKEIKSCTAYSLEYVFNYKKVDIGSGTYNFCNPVDNTDTIMGMIVEAVPDWSIGEVDDELIGRWRTFEQTDDNWYSFMTNELQETYNCVFLFDTKNKRINVISANRKNKNLPIYLSFDNLLKEVNIEELSEEVVTVLSGYGSGDDVNIREVNPNGSDKIYNLDYFLARGDLPDALADKWRQYKIDVNNQKVVYTGLQLAYRERVSQLMAAEAKRDAIQTDYNALETTLRTNQEALLVISEPSAKRAAESQIGNLKADLENKKTQLDDANAVIDDGNNHGLKYDVEALDEQLEAVINWVKIKNYFTSDELKILSQYFIEDSISEETFTLSEFGSATSDNMFGNLTSDNLPHVTVTNSKIYANDAFSIIEDIEGMDLDPELQQQLIDQLNNDTHKHSVEMRGGTLSFVYTDVLNGDTHSYNYHGDIVSMNLQYNTSNLPSYVDETSSDISKKNYFIITADLENAYIDETPYQSMHLVLDGFIQEDGATIGDNAMVVNIDTTSYTCTGSVTELQKQNVLQELYKYTEDELKKLSEPSYEFSVDSANFLFAEQFEPFKNELELGSTINLALGHDGEDVLEPILIEVEFDFEDETSFELTFSDKYRSSSHEFKLADIITEASHSARSVSLNKASYSSYVDTNTASQVRKMRDSALNVSKNKIVNADNQNMEWNQTGLFLRKDDGNGGFGDNQIALINDAIVFTKDGWDTVDMAIGAIYDDNTGLGYGVAAPSIYGTMIAGENLVIENTVLKDDGRSILKQFKVDATGAWLNNASLVLSNDGDPAQDVPGGKILIDPLYGIAAGNTRLYNLEDGTTEIVPSFIDAEGDLIFDTDSRVPKNTQFYFDIRTGNAYFAGVLNAENIIAGTLNGMAITQNTLDGSALISGTVVGDKLSDGTITGGKIADSTITGAKISGGTITGAHMQDGTITSTQIANSTITGSNIVNGTITGTQIALATITDSNIVDGTITGGKLDDATITGSKIANSTVTGSNIDFSTFSNGVISGAAIDTSTFTNGQISGSAIDTSTFTNGQISGTAIDTSTFTNGQISGSAIDSSTLTNIPYAGIDWANINSADITTAWITSAMVNDLSADKITSGDISTDRLKANVISAINADLTSATINAAHIGNLDASKITTGTINADLIDTEALLATSAIIDDLQTNKADIDLANVNNAWIENGVVKDASITDAKIIGISANKLTAGTIDASDITVTNLNASNITTGTLNGQRIGDGSLSLDKLSEAVATQDYVDNITTDLQNQIDGAIETFTTNTIPTLNNYPAEDWVGETEEETAANMHKHVGDVCYVVNAGNQADGYCYRFTESQSGNFSWTLIKDSDVTKALQDLITAQGDISGLKSFETTTTNWMSQTDGAITSLQTRTSNLETDIGDKVSTSTFNTLQQTVDENSSSITTLTTTVNNKADSSTVTTLSNTVNTVSQKANANESAISSLTQTVSDNETDIENKYSTLSQDLNGFKTTVGNTYVTQTNFTGYQESNDAAVAAAQSAAEAAQSGVDRSSELIIGTQTAGTYSWTGESATLSVLSDKMEIKYWLPFSSSGSQVSSSITKQDGTTTSNSGVVLNLTLKDGSTTGDIPVYYNGSTRLTTHYAAGNVIRLIYRTNVKVNTNASGTTYYTIERGFWCDANYDTNTSYTQYSNGVMVGANGIRSISLIMRDTEDTWVSLYSSDYNGASRGKVKNDDGLMLGKVLYCASSPSGGSFPSGATTGIVYDSYPLDLRYSSNCGTTLTTYKSVYLVGTINDQDGLFYLDDTWWTQTLPTTEDGKTYIYLGEAYSTYQIFLEVNNDAYQFYNGAFMKLADIETAKARAEAGVVAGELATVKTTYLKTADFNVEKEAINASISDVETTTKTYTDGKITQEVSDRNAAITASAQSITSTVSNNYVSNSTYNADMANLSSFKKINAPAKSFTTAQWQTYGASGHSENWSTGASYDNTSIRVGDTAYITGSVTDGTRGSATIIGTVTSVTTSSVVMTSQSLLFGADAMVNVNTTASSAKTTAEQTAEKFTWLVENGSSSSSITMTDAAITGITNKFVIKDPAGNATVITGGKVRADSITTAMLSSDAIKSTNYVASSSTSSPYSVSGTFVDLATGNIFSPNFGVNTYGIYDQNDNLILAPGAYINGDIVATSGRIGEDENHAWSIGSFTDYNADTYGAIISQGDAFIQAGKWMISDDLIDTRWYEQDPTDYGQKITYPKASSIYWDFGMHAPDIVKTSNRSTLDDSFLYIRKHESSIPTMESEWDYVFRIDKSGMIYINGLSLDQKYASIDGVSGEYLPLTGGTINGNLTVTGSITGTASNALQTAGSLSINGKSFNGSSNVTVGTIGVAYGGTGKTTAKDAANSFVDALEYGSSIPMDGDTYIASYADGKNTAHNGTNTYHRRPISNLYTYIANKLSTADIYMPKAGGAFTGEVTFNDAVYINDELDVDTATVGDLTVGGAGRFTNGLYGTLTGDVVGNVTGNLTGNVTGNVSGYSKKLLDSGNNTSEITASYSKQGMSTVSWLAGWDSYELRAVSPSVVKTAMELTKSDVDLGNVDNTSDANKRVKGANITTEANSIAKFSDTSGTFIDSGIYIDESNNLVIGKTDSSNNVIHTGSLKMGVRNDSYGVMPYANNWNSIGLASLRWYHIWSSNTHAIYGDITNWYSNNNIGSPATSSAASVKGVYNLYNVCDANGTQTKTKIEANSDTNSNITITMPKETGVLALRSDIYKPLAHFDSTDGSEITSKYYKIKINSTKLWMLSFVVRLYHNYRAYDLQISGYNYGSNYWESPKAVVLGSTSIDTISVTFGYDDVNQLWISIPASKYAGIDIVNATNGYYQVDSYEGLFTITLEDSQPTTVQTVVNAYRPWYRNETVTNATNAVNATNASKVNNHTVNADVPSGALFTDTTYSTATNVSDGLMSSEDKKKLDQITVSDIGTVGANSIIGEKDIKVSISQGVATIGHANTAITAGTASGTSNSGNLAFGATVTLPSVTYDAYGHITATGTTSFKLPAAPTSVTGNAGTATQFSSNATVELTGDTTGSASSAKGWSISTKTAQLSPVADNRSVATNPSDYNNKFIFQGIKNNTTIDNPSTSTYSYLFGLRGWSDNSGGHAHELVFNNDGIYRRQGATDSWNNWEQLLDSGNYTDYTVKKDGTGATGDWDINIRGNAATASKMAILETKSYSNIIGATTADADTHFYFAKIQPESYSARWRIKYKISATMNGQPDGTAYSIVEIEGMRNTYGVYRTYNMHTNSSYRPYYYHTLYCAKDTGINNGYGHALGISLLYSYGSATTANARHFDIEVYECEGCTLTFLDNMVTYSDWPGNGSTNYYSRNNFDGATYGWTHTGDRNDVNYQQRIYYTSSIAAEAIYRYQLLLRDRDQHLIPVSSANNTFTIGKTYSSKPFDPFGEIYYFYSSSSVSANGNVANATLYRQFLVDLRYAFDLDASSSHELVARKPVYLTATPQADGTAILTKLNNSTIGPLTQDLPTSDDGFIYIYLGQAYEDSHPYRLELSLHHPVFWYKDGSVKQYIPFASKALTAVTATSATSATSATNATNATNAYSVLAYNSNETIIGANSKIAGASSNGSVWFNYRDVQEGSTSNNATKITEYHFGNRKGSTSGVHLFADVFNGNAVTATTASRVATSAATADAYCHMWFSDSSVETARAYDDDFMYNPYKNDMKVKSVTMTDWNVKQDATTGALVFSYNA